jgi:uncharacterized protein
VKAIADTGFIVAFANADDEHHGWAVELARQVTDPLLTCEAVLAEAAFHLGSVPLVLEFIDEGLLKIAFSADEQLAHIASLAARYSDRKPDLADLCLIRMSEMFPMHKVITTDRADFRVYRRNKRDVIPTLFPPQ